MSYRKPSLGDIYYPDPSKNDHDRIVLISRHMDAIIAERLRTHPEYLSLAKSNLKRWMELQLERNGFASAIFKEWEEILSKKSLQEIVRLLLSETQDADRLRSSSPFCGILTEEERLTIFKAHGPVSA